MENQGGRALAAELERRSQVQEDAEKELRCSRGLVSRLISGERKPGRSLSLSLEELYGIKQRLWDLSVEAQTGTDG